VSIVIRRALRRVLGAAAVFFGVMTLFAGGRMLFGGEVARQGAGQIVEFVLLFNFGAGFAYVTAGVAALLDRRWSVWVARGLAVATGLVFAALGAHILGGGAFEEQTVVAMTVRTTFWTAQAVIWPYLVDRRGPPQ